MATRILKNCKLWVAGYNLSGDVNAMALNVGAELQDGTTFADNTRKRVGGLKTLTYQHEGFFQANGTDGPDDVLYSRIGTADVPQTIGVTDGAAGEPAYFFRSIAGEYTPLQGSVGDLLRFSVSGEASGGHQAVRGTILHNATVTATGTGTAFNVGAAASGQKLYAILHVLSASGTAPTLDVVVQSDDASGMASPTTRITFTQATAVGAQYAVPINGPITDTHFRVSHTVGGTTPSFEYVVAVGIV